MTPIDNTSDLILKNEGIRLHPYLCPAGYLTIGVGRNLDSIGITRAEAFYLLDNEDRKSVV